MKIIYLYALIPLLLISLSGCSENDSQVMNNISSQIEKTSGVVNSTNSNEVNTVSIRYDDNTLPIIQVKNTAYLNMLYEEELRQDVLEMTAVLKMKQNKNYKLGKSKSNAINHLLKNVEYYTNNLSKTKKDVKEKVNDITKYTSVKSVDGNLARSSYLELNNLMQERATYLTNIRNALVEINNIIDDDKVFYNQKADNLIENNTKTHNNELESEKNSPNVVKNDKETIKNIDTFDNSANDYANETQNYNRELEYNKEYNFIRPPYNQMQNNPNFYYNGYRNTLFNPNRNTDTFYPRISNIDTYRYNPYYNGYWGNGYYGANYNSNYYNNTSIHTSSENEINIAKEDCTNCSW